MEILRPGGSHTATAGPSVDVSAARKALGIYNDPDVADADVMNATSAASGIVLSILGRNVSSVARSVYYPNLARGLDLVLEPDNGQEISVGYYDESDAFVQFDRAPGADPFVFAQSRVRMDDTAGARPILTLTQAGVEAASPLVYSEYRVYPVKVAYHAKALPAAGTAAVNTAMLQLLIALFRGADDAEMRVATSRAEDLLQPYRLGDSLL